MDTDLQLLNVAGRMNKDTLVKIFDVYASPLYKYAILAGTDPRMADRIVGDVFCKLLDRLSRGYGPPGNLRSYLFACTYHRIMSESHTSQRRLSLEDAGFMQGESDSLPFWTEKHIVHKILLQAIQTSLTDYQRHVILLHFCEGFSLDETAAILGNSVNIVKATQKQAVETLRRSVCQ
jgi:RNA polymerase sigma-70 factor (ECF subfamily)